MKNKKKRLYYFFAGLITVMCIGLEACIKDYEIDTPEEMMYESNLMYEDTETVLGDRIEDPYRIDWMRAALEELAGRGECAPIQSIEPTGVYVRVLVDNDGGIDLLQYDTSIVWFDFPLDYEVLVPGTYYHDSELLDETKSWQYAVVPMGYQFPEGVEADTIYQVFIPDDAVDYKEFEAFYDALVAASYRISGRGKNGGKGVKWTPSAIITVYDDLKGVIPLQGVRVKAYTSSKTAWAITDANGNCTFDEQFEGAVTYMIDWSRNNWRIVVTQNNNNCYLNGPTKTGKWTCEINTSNAVNLLRATIHRGAMIANYGSNWTIERPHSANILQSHYKLKIRSDNTADSLAGKSSANGNSTLDGADIVIYGKDQYGVQRLPHDVFAAIVHELGHWSHYFLIGESNMHGVTKFVAESWAFCIEWKITNGQYPGEFGIDGLRGGHQSCSSNILYDLNTPIFVDMIDSRNQHNTSSVYCDDNVSGYTLKEIQDHYVDGSLTYGQLMTNMLRANNQLHGATYLDMFNLIYYYYGFPGIY